MNTPEPASAEKPRPRDHSPFIPAILDDAELTPIQFRIICHLWRRAGGKRRCWPGSQEICRVCKISEDSLWPAINVLEKRGLLRREKRRYNSNEYILFIPDVTPSNPVTVSPPETGEPSPGITGEQSPPETGGQSPGLTGCKGTIGKVLKEGTKGKGGAEHPDAPSLFPFSLFTELPAEMQQRILAVYISADWEKSKQRPVEWWQQHLNALRARKLTYRDKYILRDWLSVIEAGLMEAALGKDKKRQSDVKWIND